MSNRKNRKKVDSENLVEETISNESSNSGITNEVTSEVETNTEEVIEEKVETNPLIKISSKPNFTPKPIQLKEEDKNINPPAFDPGQNKGMAWGPANKKTRR